MTLKLGLAIALILASVQLGFPYERIGGNLTEIPSDIPSNETEITLDKNDLITIPSLGFSRFFQLEKLNLNDCKISTIAVDAFDGAPILVLYLRNNELTDGLKCLESISTTLVALSLTSNPPALFSQLDRWEEVFTSLNSLRRLYINNLGLLDCAEIGKAKTALKYWTMSGNKIVKINSTCFSELSTLVGLQLHDNRLKQFPDFSELPLSNRLESLELQNNMISAVNSSQLERLAQLTMLNLSNNQIKTFPDVRSSMLITLDLRGNSLHCGYNISWMKKLELSSLSVLLDGAPCSQPEALVGRSWDLITVSDLEETEMPIAAPNDVLQDGDNTTCLSTNNTTAVFYKHVHVQLDDPRPPSVSVTVIGSMNCSSNDLELYMNEDAVTVVSGGCATQVLKRCKALSLENILNSCQFQCDCPNEAEGCQKMVLWAFRHKSSRSHEICEVWFDRL